eukprot:TRINITY_DN1425_c0_g1_i3.p2 TRINITY_DN1425_c0_g1~~TRINITY_DN1425_c0_g1_i3.p2  ORF type:complete len:85 (+),score=28.66 TRINITY_DN1425_c0_g1_i3:361-615(+)
MRSGREMFDFNPDLFVDEEDVLDTEELEPENVDEGPVRYIDVTGTSINLTITNLKEEEDVNNQNSVAVNPDLYNEDEIPDEDDE